MSIGLGNHILPQPSTLHHLTHPLQVGVTSGSIQVKTDPFDFVEITLKLKNNI